MVVKTSHLPAGGETVLGGDFFMNAGGKGANQAVAAARYGNRVVFVAKTGDDLFGAQVREAMRQDNINTDYVFVDKEHPSGVALILVDSAAQNSISVALGANNELMLEDVMPALDVIEEGDIVLLQLEIPMATVESAIAVAAERGARVILNPAPAAKVSTEALSKLYLITPNQTEAELLTGIEVTDEASAIKASEALCALGVKKVVITLGSDGAMLYEDGNSTIIPAHKVNAVDTTLERGLFKERAEFFEEVFSIKPVIRLKQKE